MLERCKPKSLTQIYNQMHGKGKTYDYERMKTGILIFIAVLLVTLMGCSPYPQRIEIPVSPIEKPKF